MPTLPYLQLLRSVVTCVMCRCPVPDVSLHLGSTAPAGNVSWSPLIVAAQPCSVIGRHSRRPGGTAVRVIKRGREGGGCSCEAFSICIVRVVTLIGGSGLRGLLLLVPTQTPTDVAMPAETAVNEKADERHVPNESWEPWQWARNEWENNGKIGGTAAVLVQPHCRKVDNVGGVFCWGSVCVGRVCEVALRRVRPVGQVASRRLLRLQQSGVTGRLSVMTQPFNSKQFWWSTHLVNAGSLVTAQPLHGWMTCPWKRKPCSFNAAQPLPGLVTRASPNHCESRSAQAESPGLAATRSRPRKPRKMRLRAGPQLACSCATHRHG